MTNEDQMLSVLMDIKEEIGTLNSTVGTLVDQSSDKEKRLRALETGVSKRQGAFAVIMFCVGSVASYFGISLGQ